MKNKIKYPIYFLCIAIIFLLFVGCWKMIKYTNYSEASAFDLQEIKEGTYIIYHSVSSNVPADNYDVVLLRYENQIHEYKGCVTICSTNDKPHVKIISRPNISNNDEVFVFVPDGTVEFANNVSLR